MADHSPSPAFNDRGSALSLLLTRRSARARDLVAPGPSKAQLATILAAATRVPDHGKLAPWRFVEVTDREAFAALITGAWRAERPDAGRLEIEALDAFARQAPCLVAALSCPRESHIPQWEQELSVGAAIMNLLLAAHAMGFAGNWLTGAAAYLKAVADALGGRPAGFLFLGTPSKPLEERQRPEPAAAISRWPG
ncbi:MAG: nitroreductase [Thermaurantiacus sp.]